MIAISPRVTDLSGREFGRLTVRKFAGVRGTSNRAYWICDCACGVRGKEVSSHLLLSGRAVSCGCQRADPLIRQAARLTMSEDHRQRAARGETVSPPKPPTKPAPKREKRILPILKERAPGKALVPESESGKLASMGPARAVQDTTAPPPEPAPAIAHSFWAAVTKDRHGGYHVCIRLHQRSNTPVMQSRRCASISDARREARRIFGDQLPWITGDQAGLHNQPWVVEIAEVRL